MPGAAGSWKCFLGVVVFGAGSEGRQEEKPQLRQQVSAAAVNGCSASPRAQLPWVPPQFLGGAGEKRQVRLSRGEAMSQPRMRPERAGMELGGCEERLPEESRWAGKGPGNGGGWMS